MKVNQKVKVMELKIVVKEVTLPTSSTISLTITIITTKIII